MQKLSNKQLINNFLKHLRDGKPIMRRKQTPIKANTEYKIRHYLDRLDKEWLKKGFLDVVEGDITRFRASLKSDKFRGKKGQPLGKSTKRDIEYKIMGKFFKWLGKPELIYYTDDYREDTEVPALTRQEVEKVISQCKLRDKVIWAVLFDAGVRATELLNILWSDLKDDERKAKGHYKIRIRISKTKPRTVGLYLDFSTEVVDSWIDANKDKVGTSQPLIKLHYNHMRKIVERTAYAALKKKVWPHLLRHSSATYYCHRLNKFQLCYRYGWRMSSRMPDIYIDREGLQEQEAADKLGEENALKYRKEINLLKEQISLLEAKQRSEWNLVMKLLKQRPKKEDIIAAIKRKEVFRK